MMGMGPFTSGVSTPFLQGKGFKNDGTREILVRLPKDAQTILGMGRDSKKLMKLMMEFLKILKEPW